MKPQEKFHQEVWWTLQKVRLISISTRKGEPLEWVMQAKPIKGMPPIGVRQKALLKIEKFGAIKVISKEVIDNTYGKDFIYTFELIQPKFDELYNEYEEEQKKEFDNQVRALKLFSDMTTPPETQRAEQTQLLKEQNVILKKLAGKESIGNNVISEKVSVVKQDRNKLAFYQETGDIEYKNEVGVVKSGNKDYSLLSLLHSSKNTAFNIEDIKKHCNHLVNKSDHKFKKEKDVDDTIRQIRSKLKLTKGAYFPIVKRGATGKKVWLWIEK